MQIFPWLGKRTVAAVVTGLLLVSGAAACTSAEAGTTPAAAPTATGSRSTQIGPPGARCQEQTADWNAGPKQHAVSGQSAAALAGIDAYDPRHAATDTRQADCWIRYTFRFTGANDVTYDVRYKSGGSKLYIRIEATPTIRLQPNAGSGQLNEGGLYCKDTTTNSSRFIVPLYQRHVFRVQARAPGDASGAHSDTWQLDVLVAK